MTGKLLLITIASLFFWRATVLGADYEKKTQMTVLPTPIDFSQTVFAEAETYANVAFWHLSFDAAGKPTNDAFSEVVPPEHITGASYIDFFPHETRATWRGKYGYLLGRLHTS
jgi:hypothetical protein